MTKNYNEDEIRQDVPDDWVPVITITKNKIRGMLDDQVRQAIEHGTIDTADPFIILNKFCWAYNCGLEDDSDTTYTLTLPNREAYFAFVQLFPWVLQEPA